MKIALCLYGIYYCDRYQHWALDKIQYKIDYRLSLNNYQTQIIQPYLDGGHELDTFVSTYAVNPQKDQELLETYKPKKFVFEQFDNKQNHLFAKNSHVITLCNFIENTPYDVMFIIRFDLHLNQPVTNYNIDYNKVNVSCVLEKDNLIDDAIYVTPTKVLPQFKQVFLNNLHCSGHLFNFKKIGINYFVEEKGFNVGGNPVYKIIRTHA